MEAPKYKVGQVIICTQHYPATKADSFFGATKAHDRIYGGSIINIMLESDREPMVWSYELKPNGIGKPSDYYYENEDRVTVKEII